MDGPSEGSQTGGTPFATVKEQAKGRHERGRKDKTLGPCPHHPTDLIDKINLRSANPIAA